MKEGTYHGNLKKAVTSQSKNGNPQVCMTFDVHSIWNGTDWEGLGAQAAERTVFLFLTDAAWDYTEKKLAGMGFNGNFDDPKFTEESANLRCTIEQYEGKDKEKWDIDGGGFEAIPAPKDITRNLNAKWKARATSAPKTKPPAGKPAPIQRQPATVNSTSHDLPEDEIPFD